MTYFTLSFESACKDTPFYMMRKDFHENYCYEIVSAPSALRRCRSTPACIPFALLEPQDLTPQRGYGLLDRCLKCLGSLLRENTGPGYVELNLGDLVSDLSGIFQTQNDLCSLYTSVQRIQLIELLLNEIKQLLIRCEMNGLGFDLHIYWFYDL